MPQTPSIPPLLRDTIHYQTKGDALAKRTKQYRGEKRKKELTRQKKREEKEQRRLDKRAGTRQDTEKLNTEDMEPGQES